jgi:hypothetical protein
VLRKNLNNISDNNAGFNLQKQLRMRAKQTLAQLSTENIHALLFFNSTDR